MDSENSIESLKQIDEIATDVKLVKRHAKESWIYPIVSIVLNAFGYPFAFLNVITILMGIYCLTKSYINISRGFKNGIVVHVLFGTVLNGFIILANLFLIYALVVSSNA